VLLGAGLAAFAALAPLLRDGRGDGGAGRALDAADRAREPITTTLVAGTREGRGDRPRELAWIALVALAESGERGGLVYVPPHTAAEVPGRGLQSLGSALSGGGVGLLEVTTENLLGIPLDGHLELSEPAALDLFGELEPLAVDVPSEARVTEGPEGAPADVPEGPQRLSAPLMAGLLYDPGSGSDDVERGSLHLAFWDALFERFEGEPDALEAAVHRSSPEHAATLGRLLRGLARVPGSARTLGVLPVARVAGDDSELSEVVEDEARELLALAGVGPPVKERVPVQVLNGNGAPGIGQAVGEELVGHGFEIVLSGNAHRLDQPRTLIIAHDESAEALETARRARELLGVGKVQVSARPQGIVTLTVVVGKDFLRRK
jgi:hypothetical protein